MTVQSKQIPIQSPCPIQLDRSGVSASDRAMFCGHCDKNVHLLSAMTEAEARSFMRAREGDDVCVSYAIKQDGEIRFRPVSTTVAPIVPISALHRRRGPASTITRSVAAAAIGVLLAACAPHAEPESIGVADTVTATRSTVIPPRTAPDVPCEPDDVEVDGGIEAMPVEQPERVVAGGLRPLPIAEPPEPRPLRGRIRPRSLDAD